MVDIDVVRQALEVQTARTAELLRAIEDPASPIPDSEWSVGEAAAHLAIGAEGYSEYARRLPRRHPIDLTDVAGSTRRAFEAMPERDGAKLAEMMVAGIDIFLEATAELGADDQVRWHSELTMPCATITCLLLVEQLLHGWDIARTIDVPWEIPNESARLVLITVGPFLALAVNRETAAQFDAEYELAVDGGPRLFAVCRGGGLTIGTSPTATIDCRLGGDPATWLLALWGRVPWTDLIEAGAITVEGDAMLAARFKSLLRNP